MSETQSVPANLQFSRALSALNKIGQTLTAGEAPQKVLHKIAEDAKDVLAADIVDLYEYDQARREFILPAVLVGDRWQPSVPKTRIYSDDVVVKIVASGKPKYYPHAQQSAVLTEDYGPDRDDAPENRFVVREGILSSVSLPLRAGAETVGVMFVNYRIHQDFKEEQQDLIESFASLAAIAIHNARLWKLQNEQLAALKEIIDVVGAENPLPAILKQAVTIFAADHGSISRLTEDGQNLQFQARWEDGRLLNDIDSNDLRPIDKGITGYAVSKGQPYRAGDVRQVSFYDEWYASTKSEMSIPLKNAFEGIIGVLNLESDHLNFFTEEHEKLCISFANAASAAIQQSDLIENIQSLHALTEWHNLKELLDGMLKNLVRMMGANTASSVNLYDKENNNFYSFHGVGPNQEFVNKYLLVPPRENGTGRHVLKTRQPLFYEDVTKISAGQPPMRTEAKEQRICSFAVLPLMYQEDILGTLFIHKIGEPMVFTEDARRILATYATQTALAIHNAQHRVDIEPLKDVLSAAVSAGNREKILNQVVEKAVHIMASDYASIWLGEKETGDLVRQAIHVRAEERQFLNLETDRLQNGHASINMAVYRTGDPVFIGDVSQLESEGRYNRIYQKARSEIAVPLKFRDEIIGTLNTESQNLGAYSELDMATLRIVADVATIAIKMVQGIEELSEVNTRITREVENKTEELRKRNEELYHMNFRLERKNAGFEALTQISQQLTANIRRAEQEIVSIIHRQASQIMDTNNMYIAFYEPREDMVTFRLAYLDGRRVDIENEKGWEPRSGGRGRTEWIIRNKAPILILRKDEARDWYNKPGTEEYIGETLASWLGVPIMFGEQVMGVIATFHKTEEYKYSPDDLKVLNLMGRQAAIALQNARLIRQLDRRIVELDNIRELGEDLSSQLI